MTEALNQRPRSGGITKTRPFKHKSGFAAFARPPVSLICAGGFGFAA